MVNWAYGVEEGAGAVEELLAVTLIVVTEGRGAGLAWRAA